MGFCSVITQKKLHPDISQFYLKIFKSVVTILKIIQAAQSPIVRIQNEEEGEMKEERQVQKRLQVPAYINLEKQTKAIQ